MRESESIQVSESLTIISRTYYSIIHLKNADRLTGLAKQIEDKYNGKTDMQLASELNTFVTATVFCTISFLEAFINEIFSDCADNHLEHRKVDVNEWKILGNDVETGRSPNSIISRSQKDLVPRFASNGYFYFDFF